MSCSIHGPQCVGTIWCDICQGDKSAHTHTHPVAAWQAHWAAHPEKRPA